MEGKSKKSLRKWLFGAVIAAFALTVLGYILIRTACLPGIHFIGRYCSINEGFICYWYDGKAREFTGETSEISLKVSGFSESKNGLWGTLAIEGYEMEKDYENASGAEGKIYYRHNAFPALSGKPEFHYAEISYTDYYIAYKTTGVPDSSPAMGYRYVLYFCKENTYYVRVVIQDEHGAIRIGYCADSLEGAKAVQQHYWNQNWQEE